MSKSAGLLPVAILALVALPGCQGLLQSTVEYDKTEQVKITEIRVDGGSGDVVVRSGDPGRVDIHQVLRFRGDVVPDEQTYVIEGTVLRIRTQCEAAIRCGVSYVIRAPEGVRISGQNGSGNLRVAGVSTVDFDLGSGDITVRSASGDVRITTGSGNIELIDVHGEVNVRTSSGDIEALDLRSDTIMVNTESGNVRMELLAAANVRAATGSGDVRLAVPTGTYRVDTETGSGDTEIRIPNNPQGAHQLMLRTGSGNIVVNPRRQPAVPPSPPRAPSPPVASTPPVAPTGS